MSAGLPDAAELAAIRHEATEHWQEELSVAEQGWAVAQLDLEPVLSPFGVSVAPSWELVVLTRRSGRDGEGRVLAIPLGSMARVRDDLGRAFADLDDDDEPPPVEGAAVDLGQALRGPRDDRGLLLASLAVRELAEVGAAGHGWDWLEETIVEGDGPLPELPDAWGAPLHPDAWDWGAARPSRWSPEVQRDPGSARVRFFTYGAAGGHALACHVDLYGGSGLVARRSRTTVARARGGYTP